MSQPNPLNCTKNQEREWLEAWLHSGIFFNCSSTVWRLARGCICLGKQWRSINRRVKLIAKPILFESSYIFRFLMSNLEVLSRNDNYDKWRQSEAKSLKKLIEKRIETLQNPKNCSKAKFLKCYIQSYSQGFGGFWDDFKEKLYQFWFQVPPFIRLQSVLWPLCFWTERWSLIRQGFRMTRNMVLRIFSRPFLGHAPKHQKMLKKC